MIGILGASGYVAQEFISELVKQETTFREYSRSRCEYNDLETLINVIHEDNITALINCAGYTGKPNVDACEYNKDECYNANVELAKTIATACAMTDTTLLHVSSGCIYTGSKEGEPFTEEDEPNFHDSSKVKGSFYSVTKTLAENVVKSIWPKSYIARLRIPFDNIDGPRNYLTKLQNYEKLLNAENSISHKGDFVKACIYLLKNQAEFGIYNIVNSGSVTTWEVAEILKDAGLMDSYTLLDERNFYKEVKPKAPRSNCVLDNTKLINSGFEMRSAVDALKDSIKTWKTESIEE